jgi:hypothetical protein
VYAHIFVNMSICRTKQQAQHIRQLLTIQRVTQRHGNWLIQDTSVPDRLIHLPEQP